MPELTAEELALIEAGASVDDDSDDVDEILLELQSQKTVFETRYTELSERLNQCLTKLEQLSVGSNAENPILTQLSNQVAETKGLLESLKSSVDMNLRNLAPNELPVILEVPEDQNLPSLEESTEEPSEENAPPKPPRKNRML